MGFFKSLNEIIKFMQVPRDRRRLVFYSEGRNYWPHLGGLLRECLAQSEEPVIYITSDAQDPGLTYSHPRLKTFLTDEGWVRNYLFENIDCDVMVMTTPDLGNFQLKRSRFPVHYVYVQHSAVSLHMVYREHAFDHFDTVCLAGPHHKREIRALEEHYNLPPKNIIEHGYSRLDHLIRDHEDRSLQKDNDPPHVLFAPSWGNECSIESHGLEIIKHVLQAGFKLTLRPHPETRKRSPGILNNIDKHYATHPLFRHEQNVADSDSLYDSDIMISDWSGAALDYAFSMAKPVIFIDVPRKVNNTNYDQIGLPPLEESIRQDVGFIVSPQNLQSLPDTITSLLSKNCPVINPRDYLYNVGTSDQVGASEILALLHGKSR